jgi:hypothetical protein
MCESAMKQPMLPEAVAGMLPVAHGGKVEIAVRQ